MKHGCLFLMLFVFMAGHPQFSVHAADFPRDFYFTAFHKISQTERSAMRPDILRNFKQIYSEEEIFFPPDPPRMEDLASVRGKKYKCLILHKLDQSSFNPETLTGMPLEVLSLSFLGKPEKLSMLRPLLPATLKELYLENVILDAPQLLRTLDLETLSLNAETENSEITDVIAQMKKLKRLSIVFTAKNGRYPYPLRRRDIPFAAWNHLKLHALYLRYADPSAIYFLDHQKQLEVLIFNTWPLREETALQKIAGRKFELLDIQLPNNNREKTGKLVEQNHIMANVLLINDKPWTEQ